MFDGCLGAGMRLHELLSVWLEMEFGKASVKWPWLLLCLTGRNLLFSVGIEERTFPCLLFGVHLQQMHLAHPRLPYLRKILVRLSINKKYCTVPGLDINLNQSKVVKGIRCMEEGSRLICTWKTFISWGQHGLFRTKKAEGDLCKLGPRLYTVQRWWSFQILSACPGKANSLCCSGWKWFLLTDVEKWGWGTPEVAVCWAVFKGSWFSVQSVAHGASELIWASPMCFDRLQ